MNTNSVVLSDKQPGEVATVRTKGIHKYSLLFNKWKYCIKQQD